MANLPDRANGGDPPDTEAVSPSSFTLRAIAIGCFCAFTVSAGAAYGTMYLRGSFMALGTSMPGAVILLFVLTLIVNPLLKLIHPRTGLHRGELLVVYIMMVMASPIPTLFVGKFLSTISYAFYYATPENDWRELLHPHIPDWLMVRNFDIVRKFYEGGGRMEAIPWEAWQPVFLAWMPFVWALFLVMISIMVIMRKQWIDHERLIYPLMQVPLAMTEEGGRDDRLGPFFKNPVMWAGFAIPALWGTLHGLYNYFPGVFPFAQEVDPLHMRLSVFHGVTDMYVLVRFNIIGFFYFLKTEIAFSLWFFNLLFYAIRGLFGVLGIASTQTASANHGVQNLILAQQAMGAMLVLFFGGLWSARMHLRDVLRKAFLSDSDVDDSEEILSYRGAVLVLIGSTAITLGWVWLAGLPLGFGIAVLLLGIVILYGYSRVVAESGLSDGEPPIIPAGILVSAVGSSAMGPQGLIVLATTFMWTTGRNFVMVSCANSLRLGEEVSGNKRWLFWVLFLALAVSLGGAIWIVMTLGHRFGGINMWIWGGGEYTFVEKLIRTPMEPYVWSWLNAGIGATIMTLLTMARWLYVWWPLHPLGYAIGSIWIIDALWFNMFIAWLIKVLVLKYGGVRLYLKTRPFFMGMILGYFTPAGFYLVIDHFTGMVGNVIFWG